MRETVLSLALVMLGVGNAAATRDTIPPRVSEFRGGHATLVSSFHALLAKAVAPAATQIDRASLIMFLRVELLPHAQAEEVTLYPAVERALGTKGYATATMVMDHRRVARLLDEMATLTASDPPAYMRRAYELDALIRAHFDKEEAFILPILSERLSPADLEDVLTRIRLVETP